VKLVHIEMRIIHVYYLLKQTAKHKEVLEKLSLLLTITEVLTIDKATVLKLKTLKINRSF